MNVSRVFQLYWFFFGLVLLLVDSAFAVDDSQWENVVQPFLQEHCGACHQDPAESSLNLAELGNDFSKIAKARQWETVVEALQFGDMPPEGSGQPDRLALAEIIQWIELKLHGSPVAEARRNKLLLPEYGNYVNHDLLFSGRLQSLAFSPSRLWRFSPQLFKGKGIRDAKSPFSFVTGEGNIRDYAAISAVDQSTIQMILINTHHLLDQRKQEGEFKRFQSGKLPEFAEIRNFLFQEFRMAIGRPPTESELQKYLGFFEKNVQTGNALEALTTTITAMYLCAESVYRMEIGLGEIDEHGRRHLSPEEIAYSVAYALTDWSPERNEVIREALRRKQLNDAKEVALVVSEILDQGMSPHKTPRITRFFEEYFGYNKADKVFKDMARVHESNIRQWNTQRLMYEAEQFIQYWINRDQDVIQELLTSNRFYVAHPGDNEIADQIYREVLRPDYVEIKLSELLAGYQEAKRDPQGEQEQEETQRIKRQAEERVKLVADALEDQIAPFPGWPYTRINGKPIRGQSDLLYIGVYNLPPTGRVERQVWSWEKEQPFELPKNQRAGLLTHPAWLAAHSLNDGNDPVRRGHWVQEKLLAGIVPDVPPDVDANVPNDPHKTLRERMDLLREEKCWRCHRKMNPLGEPFEVFDDWGRYRKQVYFDENNQIVHRRGQQFEQWLAKGKLRPRAINAKGEIVGTGEVTVDGNVRDAIEMMNRIGRSKRARQTFIRYLFRYFMGRNEMLSDSRTLVAAEKAYLENGGSFKALVVSLLSSDSFLYRR
ncbi:MAG: DUF1588 domain-containing protein [Planctomycetota bacterium]|nr:DUF1588 domain-containing protein [Planctomycetota bacterium]